MRHNETRPRSVATSTLMSGEAAASASGHEVASTKVVCDRPGEGGASCRAATFPDRDALIRLVGAVLAEQHDEWTEGRRYLGVDVLARARISLVPAPETSTEEATSSTIPALSA